MSIKFTSEDWARIKEDYDKWWNRKIDRPLIKVTLQNEYDYSGTIPLLSQESCHRLDISAEDVIERIHIHLEHQEFLGDSFPSYNFDCFGPGLVAAFLGARLDNSTGKVWFHPKQVKELRDMHFEFDKNNVWFNRVKDIYGAGMKKWKGNVLMGMPDLGGILDVLATLRGSQELLCDFYDNPEEVKRVSREIQEIWLEYYRAFEEILMPQSPGYTDWSGEFSITPVYVVQCDLSYMIGPDMFKEFVADDLNALCGALSHSLFHMDGKGELVHLPQLMEMESLDAIQWCPGEGVPRTMEWMDVYRQIRQSGKNMQILGNETDFKAIVKEIGMQGLYFNIPSYPVSARDEMLKLIDEYK